MIFEGTTAEDNYIKSYWLASPGIYFYSWGTAFGPGAVINGRAHCGQFILFHSKGYWAIRERAVRPIVSLKSDITVDDIKVIDETEEEWTGAGPSSSEAGDKYVKQGQIN